MKRVNTSQMVQFQLAYHYSLRGRRLTEAGHELTTFSSLDKSCEIDSNGGEFDRVHLNLSLANDHAKKFDTWNVKGAFGEFKGQSMFSETK